MADNKVYSIKEAKNIIIEYLKNNTKIREFSYIVHFLFSMCNISDDIESLTKKDISAIKEKIDKFGYDNIYKIDKEFKKRIEDGVAEAREKDNRPNTIDIKIELKNSKWWTQRRVLQHLGKIGSMLNSKDIEIQDVKTSFKNVTILCEYAPPDSVYDKIEEYVLENKNNEYSYQQVANAKECSIDSVKRIVPKVLKEYIT